MKWYEDMYGVASGPSWNNTAADVFRPSKEEDLETAKYFSDQKYTAIDFQSGGSFVSDKQGSAMGPLKFVDANNLVEMSTEVLRLNESLKSAHDLLEYYGYTCNHRLDAISDLENKLDQANAFIRKEKCRADLAEQRLHDLKAKDESNKPTGVLSHKNCMILRMDESPSPLIRIYCDDDIDFELDALDYLVGTIRHDEQEGYYEVRVNALYNYDEVIEDLGHQIDRWIEDQD